jgi:hypothetical protein
MAYTARIAHTTGTLEFRARINGVTNSDPNSVLVVTTGVDSVALTFTTPIAVTAGDRLVIEIAHTSSVGTSDTDASLAVMFKTP